MRRHRLGPRATAALALALVLAGCASADKHTSADASLTVSGTSVSASASTSGASGGSGAGAVAGSNSKMSGMTMNANGTGTTTVLNAQGVPTPVPIRTIGSGTWKQMRIQAEEMTPVPFYVYNGQSFRELRPTARTSFHLMVMLTDKSTGVAIPYATVWTVITDEKTHRIVFNEPQWQMISEYMGPHYGNDVTLPGPGTYQLDVLVSPPVAALHTQFANMWLGRHSMTSTFTWDGK